MDSAPPDSPMLPAAPLSVATLFAFVGLLAVAVGWFLPWVAKIEVMGVSAADLRRLDEEGKTAGVPADVVAVTRRMLENEAVSGNDLGILGRYRLEQEKHLEPRERRGWTLGLAVLRWAPWVTVAAALLLAFGRMRKPGTLPLTLALTVALLVGGFAGLLWLGSSQQAKDAVAEDPKVLGLGIYAIAVGGLGAFFAGLFALRASTWWKVIPLTGLAVTGVVMACLRYVGPA